MGTTAGRVADSASPPWRLDLTAKRKQENATGLGTSDFAIAARAPGLVVAPSLAQLLHSPKIDRKPGLASADKKADENPYARASTSLRTIAARRDAASVAAPRRRRRTRPPRTPTSRSSRFRRPTWPRRLSRTRSSRRRSTTRPSRPWMSRSLRLWTAPATPCRPTSPSRRARTDRPRPLRRRHEGGGHQARRAGPAPAARGHRVLLRRRHDLAAAGRQGAAAVRRGAVLGPFPTGAVEKHGRGGARPSRRTRGRSSGRPGLVLRPSPSPSL